MTWNVLQDDAGNLQLLESTFSVPEGWTIVAVTCNPDYLDYMISLIV